MRIDSGVVSMSLWMLAGCSGVQPRLLPELTRLDVTRPYVVYAPVTGTGCGPNALSIAVNDLLSIADVHGFVGAVLETSPEKKGCVVITARPFTYGCEATPHGFRTPQPRRVPAGPQQCAAPVSACDAECATFANALGGGEFQGSAVRNRCLTRCQADDAPFMTCARAATSADAVRACDDSR